MPGKPGCALILIVSTEQDLHAREVMAGLDKAGAEVSLLDLSEYPARSFLTIEVDQEGTDSGFHRDGQREVLDFPACRVIWWRRPQPFGLPAEIDDPDAHQFSLGECHSAFSGLWLTLDPFWINHPTKDDEAARKVFQLKRAVELGFRVPRTRVTNSPERALRFIEEQGTTRTIYKAFSATERAWRETRLLREEELALLDNVRYAPVIFQEYIPAKVDLRITVIGDAIFAAAIHSQETEYKVDFRMAMDAARFEAWSLPTDVEDRIRAYMRSLGLVYGAIDMRLTPDGEYVFLEINPCGQWLFVEQRTGQPITRCLVQLMLEKDREDRQ